MLRRPWKPIPIINRQSLRRIGVSIFSRLGRTRRPEESDDEGEDDGPEAEDVPLSKDPPPISCRPVSRIIGFECTISG